MTSNKKIIAHPIEYVFCITKMISRLGTLTYQYFSDQRRYQMEVYDYVITKPELNEGTLAHYGIAKKVHKYIDKYLKNGKWIYRYKSKAQELGTKINRKLRGADTDQISFNYGKEPIYGYAYDNGKATSRTGTRGNFQGRNGKDVMPASGHTDGLRVAQGTAAGRKRAKKAKTIRKFNQRMNRKAFPTTNGGWYTRKYSQNFRTNNRDTKKLNPKLETTINRTSKVKNKTKAQGYNSSIGSADNNKATNTALKARENREYIKNHSALKRASSSKKNRNMMNDVYTRETVGKRKRRIKQINDEERTLLSKGWKISNGILYPPNYKPNKKKKK